MARISELHYSDALARNSGVAEFLEVALGPGDDPADFTVSFYQSTGNVGFELTLDDPGITVSVDPDNGEVVYVISADVFPIKLTDPDGSGSTNYEAYALTDTSCLPGTVIDFYDIGGGTQNIEALDGAAAGAISENLSVLTGPNSTTTTIQFNQPNPGTQTFETIGAGDTGPACFVAGTQLETPDGTQAIDTLSVGDVVWTQDAGPQPILWIGSQEVDGRGDWAPIRFEAGVLGLEAPLEVSPLHRILVDGWQSELLFGHQSVLVAAKALVNGKTVRRMPRDRVTYMHLLLPGHHILSSYGLGSESLYLGHDVETPGDAEQILGDALQTLHATTAHPCIKVQDAKALRGALQTSGSGEGVGGA